MKTPQLIPFLILPMLLLIPGAAWACGFGPVRFELLDYLIVGVMLATGFKLMVQWKYADRPEFSTAIYLSCYILALGGGALSVDSFSLNIGALGTIALCMMPLSAFNIRNVVGRTLWFAPQFAFALLLTVAMLGGLLTESAHPKFESNNARHVESITF